MVTSLAVVSGLLAGVLAAGVGAEAGPVVSAAIAATAAVWAAWLTHRARVSAIHAEHSAVVMEGYGKLVQDLRVELGVTKTQVAEVRQELVKCETRSAAQALELFRLRQELGLPRHPHS